jgi:hypothetical protein
VLVSLINLPLKAASFCSTRLRLLKGYLSVHQRN